MGAVVKAEYAWSSGPDRCAIRVETEGASFLPPEGSASQFITEHYWGYAAQRGGGCLEYEVQQPAMARVEGEMGRFFGNAAGLFGAEIAKVLAHNPDSAFLAEGSPVTVFKDENRLMRMPSAGRRVGTLRRRLRVLHPMAAFPVSGSPPRGF